MDGNGWNFEVAVFSLTEGKDVFLILVFFFYCMKELGKVTGAGAEVFC